MLLVGSGNTYALTDLDGFWSMTAKLPAKVSVSYLGYVTKEVRIDSGSPVTVTLQEDMNMLDEIVVVGYGTMEKRAVTSSITSISSKDLLAGQGGSTIATALKGKISGMTITETSSPNTSSSMQLRGVASINAAASPLVVVDGVPGADIRSINFEDVLSVDVLKDASAGAIYGTRAAAGVILITTKKPNEGPMRLSYTAELSTEQVSNRPELLNSEEFLRYGLGSDLGSDNDWYGALLNEGALSHRHVVNLSGGGRSARVYATFVASDQKGIALGDNRKDYSGRINGSFSLLDDLLEINVHTEYREAHRDQRATNSNFGAAFDTNGDRYREVRQTFDKVGSTIQWIDNPLNILISTFKFTAFFGDDGVLWVRFTNRVDNHRFGSFIYVGHEIVTAFLARFYSVRGFIVFGN